jgi:FkbM family methyltransferase
LGFETKLRVFYEQLELAGVAAIDVGAYSGLHAIPLARVVGPTGIVHAFEPLPKARAELVSNLVQASLHNVIIYPFALAAGSWLAEFNHVTNLPQESGLKQRHQYNAVPEAIDPIPVAVYPLDRFVSRENRVGFVKIETQGGELDVLRGATNLMSWHMPVISFSCGAASFLGYHDNPGEIFELLSAFKYSVHSIHGDRIASAEHFRDCSFEQRFWDYIAIPADRQYLSTFLS